MSLPLLRMMACSASSHSCISSSHDALNKNGDGGCGGDIGGIGDIILVRAWGTWGVGFTHYCALPHLHPSLGVVCAMA
jgi:hypothetical protein